MLRKYGSDVFPTSMGSHGEFQVQSKIKKKILKELNRGHFTQHFHQDQALSSFTNIIQFYNPNKNSAHNIHEIPNFSCYFIHTNIFPQIYIPNNV